MKIKKLLVLAALMLTGNSVWAVDGNVWVIPAFPEIPEVTQFTSYEAVTTPEDGAAKAVYLYNVASHLFYSSGNNWGTHASIISADNSNNAVPTGECIRGSLVYFLSTSEAVAKGADVVELKTWVYKFNEFRSAFGGNSGVGDCWTDNNGRDDRFWKVTDAGNQTYRISNVKNFTNFFLGWDPKAADTRLSLLDPAAPEVGVDWKLVPADAYEAWLASVTEDKYQAILDWQTARATYNAAMVLKETLEKAEAINASVADQLAVYNNTESTLEQLQNATAKVEEAIVARTKELEQEGLPSATGSNPKSATTYIINPDFKTSVTNGWTAASGTDNFGANGGKENAELYDKAKFDVSQTISGLPNGVYAVGVNAFYRAGSSVESYKHFVANDEQSRYAKVYADNGTDIQTSPLANPFKGALKEQPSVGTWAQDEGKTLYIPNNMIAAEYCMHTLGLYANKVFNTVENGTLRIGVKKDEHLGADWAIFDDFSLTYYGAGADAYQVWCDDALAGYDATVAEGTLCSGVVRQALVDAITGKTATNKDEVLANIAAAEAAQKALSDNISMWSVWQDSIKIGQNYMEEYFEDDDDAVLDAVDNLMEYVDEEEGAYKEILAQHNLDNAALRAELDKLNDLVSNLLLAVKSKIKPGDDVTKFLTNPDFADGETGWTGWRTIDSTKWPAGSKVMPKVSNSCAEAFSSATFDLYQEISNAPVGVYEISVQGFYRYGRGDNAWNYYQAQEEPYVQKGGAPVYVYMNDKRTPFNNVYDVESQGMEFYKSIAEVDAETNEPKMNETLGVYIWKSGVPYGVQNVTSAAPEKFYPDGMAAAELVFNQGLYTYTASSLLAKKGDVLRIGVKGSTVAPNEADCWAIFDNFKLTYKGFDIEFVKPMLEETIADATKALNDKKFGTDLRSTLEEKLAAAEAALGGSDGLAMFNAAAELVAIDIDASVALFEKLEKALLDFEAVLNNQYGICSDATIGEGWQLQGEVSDALESNRLTDAQAQEYIDKMEKFTPQLYIPDGMMDATDEKPVEVTSLITNPTFDTNRDGWTATGSAGNSRAAEAMCEVWRTSNTNTIYQDLKDLPAGTYELQVQGVYRFGWADNDFKTYEADANAHNNASLFAEVDGTRLGSKLPRMYTLGQEYVTTPEEETAEDGTVTVKYPVEAGMIWAKLDTANVKGIVYPDQLTPIASNFEGGSGVQIPYTSVTFKVGEEGKARIGIVIDYEQDGDWTVWDNFKLIYYGANSQKELTGVNGVTTETATVVRTEIYNLAGARVNNARGLAILKQTMSDGTTRVKKVIVK